MTSEERQLITALAKTVNEMSDRLDSFHKAMESRFSSLLQRLEAENDLLRELLERFVMLLEVFEKLIHKIRTAFMESRIWEELEEYRKNDSRRQPRSKRTTGFDVERKLRRSAK